MIVGKTVVGLMAAGLSTVMASAVESGAGAGAGAAGLFARSTNSTNDLNGFKGALLLKNGRQTSCEVALMDNSYGFVAANCLDYQATSSSSNGTAAMGGLLQLNQTTEYTVMVSQGFVGAFATLGVSRVTPNAQYDPVSFANNVALVEFGAGSGNADSFVNYIASWRPEWSSMYYVRRALNTATNSSWTQPAMATSAIDTTNNGGCAAANTLFALNTQDLLCSTTMAANVFNASCAIPFGSVYGVVGANTAVAALYSHSAVATGDSQPQSEPFCRGSTTYNYYIVLQHYVHWAMELMGRKAPVFHSHLAEYSEVLDPNYSMAVPSPKSVAGYTVYGGDLYNLQPPAGSLQEEAAGKKKLSGGAVAGIVLALLALLALLAGLFLWRRMRKLKSNRVRRWWFFGRFDNSDEKREQQDQLPPRELMDDLEYAPHARRSKDSWDGAADLMDQNTVIGSSDSTPPHPLKLKSGSFSDSEDERSPRRGKAGGSPSYAIEF
ncbi:hypothetical protein IWW48_004030 [Coemansia sp. RSA 1200]|nr:hypothetical protein IWW48_004030 [Coemansia sp. RSA 1200]